MAKIPSIKVDLDKVANQKKCGIIMPIASHPDYPNEHWKDVLSILTEAINETDFQPSLVSDDVAIGLIHDRIVTNIYYNDIVVCDVSSKNPNVMFELGLRLAFDKPTIIIKDEKTGYSFDTGVIEHIPYPSSLRFSQIVDFKEELKKRINATYEKSQKEQHYSPFLKSFGKTIIPATFHQTEVPEGKYILEQLEVLRREIRIMRYDRVDNNMNYERNKFRVSENAKRHILDNVLKMQNINNININDKECLEMIQKDLSASGVEISLSELKDYIYCLDKNYQNKDRNNVA